MANEQVEVLYATASWGMYEGSAQDASHHQRETRKRSRAAVSEGQIGHESPSALLLGVQLAIEKGCSRVCVAGKPDNHIARHCDPGNGVNWSLTQR